MTIYDKNLEVIKNLRVYMSGFMDKLLVPSENNKVENIQSIDTRDSNKALLVEISGNSYRLNSSYNPISEAKKWVEQFETRDIEVVISMYGFGNGFFARELLGKMASRQKLIIYEPSKDIFLHTMRNYDITDLLEDTRVYIAVDELNESEFPKSLEINVHWINVHSQVICTHPKYNEMFPESKKLFKKVISDSNDLAIINRNTEEGTSKAVVINTIKNIKFIKDSNRVSDFIGVFNKDIPVIIVSAGPSLDKNIKELQRAKGKAVIIAVDTAIKYLLANDILPDFTVSIDSEKTSWHYRDERSRTIPLFCRGDSNHIITEMHTGKKVFFQGHEYFDNIYEKLNKKLLFLASGGSVSTIAFSLAEKMGFKRVVLIGLDLSYSEDGSTHAGQIKVQKNNFSEDIFIEGVNGNMLKTRHDWYCYYNWFNESVKHFEGEEVIDATEGGAKIRGTKIMPLKNVVDQYCTEEIDVNEIFNSINPTFNDDEMKIVNNYISESITDLEDIRKKTKDSIEICNKLISEYKKISDESYTSMRYSKELLKNNGLLQEFPISKILDTYIVSKIINPLAGIYKMGDDEKDNKIKTYESAKEVYKAINDSIDEIKDMLGDLPDIM